MTYFADYLDVDFGPAEIHVEKYTSNGNICLRALSKDTGEPLRQFTKNFDKLGLYQIAINISEGAADTYVGILQSANIIEDHPEGGAPLGYGDTRSSYPVFNLTQSFRSWMTAQG